MIAGLFDIDEFDDVLVSAAAEDVDFGLEGLRLVGWVIKGIHLR